MQTVTKRKRLRVNDTEMKMLITALQQYQGYLSTAETINRLGRESVAAMQGEYHTLELYIAEQLYNQSW